MKRNVYTAGFFVLFCLYALPCLASITGTITDTTGSPVSGAFVTFTDESVSDNRYSDYTDDDGKYELPISLSSVDEETPSGFQLDQNYPNPFNPSTTIQYSLNEAGYVNLSIYNITGQKIRTLVDNYHSIGSHAVTWNSLDDSGKSIAAGLYIYQLKCGDTVESRKMLLIDGSSNGSFSGSSQIVTRANVMSKFVSDVENKTFLVTITGDDIVPYEVSGVTVVDGETYDFVVVRKTPEIPDITFVTIPSGTFQMGDETGDLSSECECKPVHTVTLDSFEMSRYEITNEQYAIYLNTALLLDHIYVTEMGVYAKNGKWIGEVLLDFLFDLNTKNQCWISYNDSKFIVIPGYENWPVVHISWFGAKAFALYYGFDLPTEAEWEYAARGGKQYKYGTDDGTIAHSKANFDDWQSGHPVDVGSYPANPFGLYDMAGNVFEWCHDWFGSYSNESVTNPMGPESHSCCRVVRDGGWSHLPYFCRSAYRSMQSDDISGKVIGFRVVRRKPTPPEITFVTIPGGTFQMGSDEYASPIIDEKPIHTVTVSPFKMSVFEVTNAQYSSYLNEALKTGDVKATNGSVKGATGEYNGQVYLALSGNYSVYPSSDW